MRYLLFVILFISFAVNSLEYGVEYSKHKTQMEWKGVSHAKYDFNLKSLGLIVYHESGFGVRAAYGRARSTLPQQGAAHPDLIIHLDTAVDLEVLYRHTLYGKTMAYWGVGYYWDHLPISSNISEYTHDDWDNGWGWTIGLEHRMHKYLSATFNIKRRSVVGPSWKHNGALGSTHNSIGLGLKVVF